MKDIRTSSIVICSIVRDAESGLKKNIPIVEALCERFGDYRVVIFENDSKDATKQLLAQWQQRDNEHVFAFMRDAGENRAIPTEKSSGSVNPFFSRKRIGRMAALRNQYMQYLDKVGWDVDYLLVVDLDVACLSLDGILSSFEVGVPMWDAVTAYGYSTSPSLKRRYHDTYALVEYGKSNEPQTEMSIRNLASHFASLLKKGKWIRVDSAFGGLSIYRFEAVRGLRYYVMENGDKRVEVRCEHQSIYRQMAERGACNVYVNPKMKLKYQKLTFKIIWKALKRRLLGM